MVFIKAGKIRLSHTFDEIISLNNLLLAWREFVEGKRNKRDVQYFQFHLMDNFISLRYDLATSAYRHGGYRAFNVSDPKPRNIHKASVQDRLVHHAIYRILCPFFDRTFIADSYSCRLGKGTCKALNRFRQFAYKTSENNTRTCWVLKGDIRKFFASIDHDILANILKQRIKDGKVIWLLNEIIGSFSANNAPGIGLPLGNLTSQLLANVYMNEFDQFIKRRLKIKYYIRYSDDFCVLADDKIYLERLIKPIEEFLSNKLRLTLHPDKIFIKTMASGVDFLGWVHFPDHRVLRTTTKKRMFKRIAENPKPETINSYLGLLSHGNAYKLRRKVADFGDLKS